MSGDAAFPVTGCTVKEYGMSLRDYFAAKAMEGMLASPELMVVVTTGDIRIGTALERLAIKAYEMSNAMLKARGKV